MVVQTEVLGKSEPTYNMCGQVVSRPLHDTDDTISNSIVNRVYPYALKRLKDSGFDCNGWKPLVYTIDRENQVCDRFYCVRWTNSKGGYIELVGILINKWYTPHLDHNFEIGVE